MAPVAAGLAVLGEVDAEGVRELASRIRLYDRPDDQSRPPTVVERAIVARQVLAITYRDKTGEVSTRAVDRGKHHDRSASTGSPMR